MTASLQWGRGTKVGQSLQANESENTMIKNCMGTELRTVEGEDAEKSSM